MPEHSGNRYISPAFILKWGGYWLLWNNFYSLDIIIRYIYDHPRSWIKKSNFESFCITMKFITTILQEIFYLLKIILKRPYPQKNIFPHYPNVPPSPSLTRRLRFVSCIRDKVEFKIIFVRLFFWVFTLLWDNFVK